MKLDKRLQILQQKLRYAERMGTTEVNLCKIQNELQELLEINEWLKRECCTVSSVTYEKSKLLSRWYFVLENESGRSFKSFRGICKIVRDDRVVGSIQIYAKEWRVGEKRKFYFKKKMRDGDCLFLDAESIEYKLL